MTHTRDPFPALSYDLVVATRNRADALAMSLPLMVGQSCPPRRLIVVDASDDPAPVARAVAQATRGWRGEVILRQSAPGLPRQRNIGLGEVTAPLVFFFDDDSLLYPGTAAEILDVYGRDADHAIAGVAGVETFAPPPGVLPEQGWAMDKAHYREARFRGARNRVERRLTALKPALHLGATLNARHPVPAWLARLNVVPVEYMTGFRMTFRTEAIRTAGFDETLGGYALDEDIDASFTAMASGLVVGARRARIYHHRCPGGRGNPYESGRMTVLNRAHVLLKHARGPAGSPALAREVWRRHLGFMALKIVSLLPGLRRAGGWERLRGAMSGVWGSFRLHRQGPRAAPRPMGAAERLQRSDISVS